MKRILTILLTLALATLCAPAFAQEGSYNEAPKGSTVPQGPHTATSSNANGAGAVAKGSQPAEASGKKTRTQTAPNALVSGDTGNSEPGNPANDTAGSQKKSGATGVPAVGAGANSGSAQ